MITITSSSMDELNSAFKKLKGDYKALNDIHLDRVSRRYKLDLETRRMCPVARNLADKVLEYCDELFELSEVNRLNFTRFADQHQAKYVFVRQLRERFHAMDKSEQEQLLGYLTSSLGTRQSVDPVAAG